MSAPSNSAPFLPGNISRLMQTLEKNQRLSDPKWLAAISASTTLRERLQSFKRKRYVFLVVILSSPWVYRWAREKFHKSSIYRSHRARNESFSRHLAKAEQEELQKAAAGPLQSKSTKVAVNAEFLRKLRSILPVIIPTWRCKEMFMIVLHTFFLIARTYLSVIVARLDGRIVKDLIAGNGPEFGKGLVYWFAIAVPATYTNSMIRYLQSKLAIAFRTRLTQHVHDLYMNNITYYKVLNLDSRISGPDQFVFSSLLHQTSDRLICTDIAKFSNSLSSLYSNVAKPLLDIIIFNYQLARSIGSVGMAGLFVNYLITARILRAATPAFGKMAAVEAKLEGDFRSAHSRLITNAEEIAFYNGGPREQTILDSTYKTLIRHVNRIYRIRIFYNMFEDFIIKYSWSAIGLIVAAVPVFYPSIAGVETKSEAKGPDVSASISTTTDTPSAEVPVQTGSRTQGFITNKRLMISLADAGGRIMYSYKEAAELAGFTARVHELISVFHDLDQSRYVRTMVSKKSSESASTTEVPSHLREFSLTDIRGVIKCGRDGIELNMVPVVTPGGDLLVKDLSFQIDPGMHLLCTGSNGVGKSAVMRIISGLWPLFRGSVDRPEDKNIIFIPQRPYLSIGTLRDQVIYPHSYSDMKKANVTDDDLMTILQTVHLDYLPGREGGWDVKKEWKDVFSGGEKQRMNLARLFYHKPPFAVLDECTSAVSTDVEGLMYQRAKEMGITLFTISHKPSLFKYHKFLLRLVGEKHQWEFTSLESKKVLMTVDGEIKQLESQIREEDKIRMRIAEINSLLGVKMNATKK